MEFDEGKPPTYLKIHPFRFVQPYEHVFKTYAKKRWLGKQLLPTLAKQFAAYSHEYFEKAINDGKVRMNGKEVPCDYVIRNSDLLTHATTREEPPILDLPIQIICDDEEFLVVNKPPSMIVHTGGGYHYNTLLAILHYEHGYKGLYVLHRIDRLTSGVVIFAKNKGKTSKFHEESLNEQMKKSYFARVAGDFPFQEKILNAPIVCLSHKDGVFSVYDPATMEDLLKNQQLKESTTKFVKIWFDEASNSSLLECSPITGRTHQIRVHLQHLGHSILNDVVYGGLFVGNNVIQQIKKSSLDVQPKEEAQIEDKVQKRVNEGPIRYQQQKREEGLEITQNKQKQQNPLNKDQTDQEWTSKWDYQSRPWQICLHSHRYRFEGKHYCSSKPYWCDKATFTIKKAIGSQQKQQDNQKQQASVQKQSE